MTDKEMIEEMARIIHFDYWGDCRTDSCSDCPYSNLNICDDKKIAEKLYNKLFPEGSVIVSKQVWEEHIEKREKANKIFEERVRQETARAFVEFLTTNAVFSNDDVNEFAKQFGVEVKE